MRRSLGVCFLFSLLLCEAAAAQPMDLGSLAQQNMAFDQQFFGHLQGMQAQNQMAQQQLMQNYIAQNGPRLQAEYQQYVASTGMQVSFQQFVYSHMMTQGGRNPGPALQQQQQNFRALQEANRTVQQGYDSYNQGYWANQQTQSNIYNRYSNEAIGGNSYYNNPQTGETYNLPYGSNQGGYYSDNQNTFRGNSSGGYNQVDPQGYEQELNQGYGGYDDE